MQGVIKFTLGFTAIVLVGLIGVGISEFLKSDDMKPATANTATVDKGAHMR
jgi:hypothetical protein